MQVSLSKINITASVGQSINISLPSFLTITFLSTGQQGMTNYSITGNPITRLIPEKEMRL